MPGRRTRRPEPPGPRVLGGYVPRSCEARSSAASRRRATTDFALAVSGAAWRHLGEPAEGHQELHQPICDLPPTLGKNAPGAQVSPAPDRVAVLRLRSAERRRMTAWIHGLIVSLSSAVWRPARGQGGVADVPLPP